MLPSFALCLVIAGPPAATPEPWEVEPVEAPDGDAKAQAIFWFRRGEYLRSRARFVEAAKAYRTSFDARRSQEALFNAAAAAELHSPVAGLAGYQAYIDAFPDGRRSTFARERLSALRGEVAQVRLRVQTQAELDWISLDGERIEADAFPRFVEPGSFDVEVRYGEGESVRDEVQLSSGQVFFLDIEDPPKPEVVGPIDAPDPIDTPPPEPDRTAVRRVFWTGVALTGAAAASIPVFGSLALYHSNEFRRENCEGSECSPGPDGEPPEKQPPNGFPFDHLQGIETFRPLTNTMIGVGVGLAVATAIVGVFAYRPLPGKKAEADERAPITVRPGVGSLVIEF